MPCAQWSVRLNGQVLSKQDSQQVYWDPSTWLYGRGARLDLTFRDRFLRLHSIWLPRIASRAETGGANVGRGDIMDAPICCESILKITSGWTGSDDDVIVLCVLGPGTFVQLVAAALSSSAVVKATCYQQHLPSWAPAAA